MQTERRPLHVPENVGKAALDDLARVPWSELRHAYGVKIGPTLEEDVPSTLRALAEDDDELFEDAVSAFFSNLCHQGTIYEASAHAVPFLAALVAGIDLSPLREACFTSMLGSVAWSSTFDAPHDSAAGSWGPGVAGLTRAAFLASAEHLERAAERNPGLLEAVREILALMRKEAPSKRDAERISQIVDRAEGG